MGPRFSQPQMPTPVQNVQPLMEIPFLERPPMRPQYTPPYTPYDPNAPNVAQPYNPMPGPSGMSGHTGSYRIPYSPPPIPTYAQIATRYADAPVTITPRPKRPYKPRQAKRMAVPGSAHAPLDVPSVATLADSAQPPPRLPPALPAPLVDLTENSSDPPEAVECPCIPSPETHPILTNAFIQTILEEATDDVPMETDDTQAEADVAPSHEDDARPKPPPTPPTPERPPLPTSPEPVTPEPVDQQDTAYLKYVSVMDEARRKKKKSKRK